MAIVRTGVLVSSWFCDTCMLWLSHFCPQGRTRQTMRFMTPYFYTKWLRHPDTEKVGLKRKRLHIKNHPCNWIHENPSDLDKLIMPININNCHWILCVSLHVTIHCWKFSVLILFVIGNGVQKVRYQYIWLPQPFSTSSYHKKPMVRNI